MDGRIACWIMEFFLRQPVDDWIVNRLVTVLPLSDNDVRLKKTILLRSISFEVSKGIVSEKTLDSLEMVEELDSMSPTTASEATASSIRTAYGDVALACTLSFLGDGSDDEMQGYYLALQRIWGERITKMEMAGCMGLVQRCWREVRKELEAVVVAVAGGESIRTHELRREALRIAIESLRAFLCNAARDLGLPFLEAVSRAVQENCRGLVGVWKGVVFQSGVLDALQVAASISDIGADEMAPNSSQMLKDKRAHTPDPPWIDVFSKNVWDKHENVAPCCGPKGEARVAFMLGDVSKKEGTVDDLEDRIGFMHAHSIHKVQAALKSSSLNLLMAVEDPLPNALEMVRQMEMKSKIGSKDCHETASKEIIHDGPGDPKAIEEAAEPSQLEEPNTGSIRHTNSWGGCVHSRGGMLKFSLLDRNKTAQTHEWDDESFESLSEKSQSQSRDIHLPSPKRFKVSPLERQDATRYVRRRKIKKWSALEEETLRDAVRKHGRGNWKFILNCHRGIFEGRTEIDLKDKWRNMTRS